MTRLTNEVRQFIINNAGKMSFRAIARHTGADIKTVSRIARQHGLAGGVRPQHITEDEAAYIVAHHLTMPVAHIARQLNRSRSTVERWMRNRDMPVMISGRGDLAGDDYIMANWTRMTDAQLAEQLGRTADGIASSRRRLGLKRDQRQICRIVREATRAATVIDARPMDEALKAADYLAAFDRTPVFRIDDKGRPCSAGKMWRYGTTRLTTDQMMAKATRKGFDPHQWRRLAA